MIPVRYQSQLAASHGHAAHHQALRTLQGTAPCGER